jgi:hypothetical protein
VKFLDLQIAELVDKSAASVDGDVAKAERFAYAERWRM